MTLYMIFLFFEIAIVLFGVFMGYRRGTGKALFRICELLVIAVVSLFSARAVALYLADEVKGVVYSMLDSSATEILSSSENAAAYIMTLAAALMAPIFFAFIFGFFKLFTLIGFNFVAGKVAKKDQLTKRSRWIGAGIGALSGVLVCSVILSPFFSILHMTGSVPTRDKEAICASIGLDEDVADAVIELLPVKSPMHPLSALMSKLASTSTVDGIRFCAIDEAPAMLAMFNDFLDSYQNAQSEGKDEISVIGNAVSSTIPHMQNSQFVSGATSSVLNSLGENIKNGNISIGGEDELSSVLADSVANVLIGISPDNITENIEVIVGNGDDTQGIIGVVSSLSSTEDMETFINEGKTDELVDILIDIGEKPELSQTMDAVKDIGVTIFSESVLASADEEVKTVFIDQITDSINDIVSAVGGENASFEDKVETASGIINGMLSQETETPLSESESELLAIFVVYYFGDNGVAVTSSDIEAFLGVN